MKKLKRLNLVNGQEETMPYATLEDAVKHLNGMDKWSMNDILDTESNKIPYNNGYFGGYTCITYFGYNAIVYVDDRDAKVQFKTPFYHVIWYGVNDAKWSGDKRWGGGSPAIIVCHNNKYNLIKENNNGAPICAEWYKYIYPTKYCTSTPTRRYVDYFIAEKENGEQVKLTTDGYELTDNTMLLEEVKKMSREEILEKWIKSGKLVVGGYGWEYRGAGTGVIDNEKAAEMFPKYSFGKGFYEMEWVEYKGQVALSMREYSVNDME